MVSARLIIVASTLAALVLSAAPALAATESIEFVQEHLAEIVMDNRYATLPIWGTRFSTQAAYSNTRSGELAVDGAMFSLAATRNIADHWHLTGFVFFDDLRLSSGTDRRPLEVQFTTGVPLTLPAQAQFTGLEGAEDSYGVGIGIRRDGTMRLWHDYEWTAGVLWHHVALRNYSLDFRILEGASAGAVGLIDYSAVYEHVAPFFGVAWPREHRRWSFSPHVQAVVPLPRRGVVGRIQGPGYEIDGDTGKTGVGTPFGDPSVTVGFDVTYRPWSLTIDLGSAFTQSVIEPVVHKGIETNWLISANWHY